LLARTRSRSLGLETLTKHLPHTLLRFFRHVLRLLVFYLAFTMQGWDFSPDPQPQCAPGYEVRQPDGTWLDCDTGKAVDP
jgi:hypothetical protein